MSQPVSEREREVLRHSLGLRQRGHEYRNGYSAGTADEPTCRALVAKGLMAENPRRDIWGGWPNFFVTDEGKRVAHETQRTEPEALAGTGAEDE
jgi:hypothetical protein